MSSPEIVDSFGYTLPHRGSTEDQGDDNGYSRVDDGDPSTYWKSDPYLASFYTHDPDSAHPQWIVIDLIHPKPVDAIGMAWVDPYATHYEVQYWTGHGDAIFSPATPERVPGQTAGAWQTFPQGSVTNGSGGQTLLRLSSTPVRVRFIRVWMTGSSNTCDSHGTSDRRNCVGYAIDEVRLGVVDAAGKLRDLIHHSKCGGVPDNHRDCTNHQTVIFSSSDDPWHTSRDRILSGQDQPGLDFVSRNAITRGLPMMYPVPLWYSTPANAAAEVRYLKARGYPLQYVEMGEEVDGQYALPEDYAALYVEFADAIHAVDPSIKLGGPVFQGVNSDIQVWPDASGDDSWFRRFLNYLRSHHHLSDLAFMSFEHYPFRGCDQGVTLHVDLLREPSLVRQVVDAWRSDGLPKDVPMFITESNFANNGGPVPKQLAGALWMADWIGTALSDGVSGINYYQYEAEPLGHSHQCDKWGGYDMFIVDQNFHILAKAAQYYGAQMITQEWLQPGDLPHELYNVTISPAAAHPSVTAYAAHRPDGQWSVMIVNKDSEARQVDIEFPPQGGNAHRTFQVRTTAIAFGPDQYGWSGGSPTEIPHPNTGLATSVVGGNEPFTVAPMSITVVRGGLYDWTLID